MKVLYITANPKAVEYSHSLSVGREFIEEYKNQNPSHEVKELDLFNADVPNIDYDVMGAWGILQSGGSFDDLSDVQKAKLGSMNDNLDEFIDADKYVFVVPFWNFGLPPVMKSYIDNVVIAGKTFQYTETGPVGLLKDKKSLVIVASGGVYSNEQMKGYDYAGNYMRVPLGFIGVTDQKELRIEGVSTATDGGLEIRKGNVDKALELARVF